MSYDKDKVERVLIELRELRTLKVKEMMIRMLLSFIIERGLEDELSEFSKGHMFRLVTKPRGDIDE